MNRFIFMSWIQILKNLIDLQKHFNLCINRVGMYLASPITDVLLQPSVIAAPVPLY
jgi:hypothetical protein